MVVMVIVALMAVVVFVVAAIVLTRYWIKLGRRSKASGRRTARDNCMETIGRLLWERKKGCCCR